ncbi:hypothetical protein LL912_12695 [Niabella sp. CC-SYL272]|uniref:hypothetical protein n=1 Tax=Niabella agricola TaxID=2891571 RepID=UPI001F31225F|nr:hypothetical protein [Niabella agricola]MCF3109631.1 hypothetical protein [Niabella agricola]
MKTPKFALIAALSLAMFSCSKEKVSSNLPEQLPESSNAVMRPAVITGVTNPYDEIGRQHNELLSKTRYYIERGGENTISGRSRFVVKVTGIDKKAADLDAFVIKIISDTASRFHNTIERQSQNPAVKNHLYQICDAIKLLKEKQDIEAVKARINEIEQQISNAINLNQTEKRALFIAASVAKHSTEYWLNDPELNPTSDSNLAQRPNFIKRALKAIAAATVDMVAAVETAFTDGDMAEIVAEAGATSSHFYETMDYLPGWS